MASNFPAFQKHIEQVKDWLLKEYQNIHTGRATPALLDGVLVDMYGAKTPIPHASSLSVEDPRTLRIVPWDKTMISEIQKAIEKSDLGVTVSSDDAGCRVNFPELSGERRQAAAKTVRNKLEEARVSVRNARDEAWSDVQKQTNEGEMTDDDKFTFKSELQEMIDRANSELEDMAEKKEHELES